MKLRQTEKRYGIAAAKAGMDPKTARKYVKLGRLPSEVRVEHNWRTREDPFGDVWEQIRSQLDLNHGLEAKTLFEDLQRRYPGRYSDGQLRTLQRRIKVWRALEGPSKEVYFPQEHRPGELCQSDFTHMNDLGMIDCCTPVHSPESNGMAESFIGTFKRDYVYENILEDFETVKRMIPEWIDDYNSVAPHSALGMKSPREFLNNVAA